MSETRKIHQELYDPNEAAAYMGVSRRFFDDAIRPHLPIIDMKSPKRQQPMWRFTKTDMDAFIASRRREKKPA